MSDTHFAERALALLSNGYRVIPIKPGEKRPGVDDWQKLNATPGQVKAWARSGFANGNVGILTENTPAIDLDIYDAEIADRMEQWVLDNIEGATDAPRRVGRAPKRLLMFRTDEPFHKQQVEFIDSKKQKHKVEILGVGQQFVAYGIHPDTKRPFEWTSFEQPLDTPVDELPILTLDDAKRVVAEFERLCRELGWNRLSGTAKALTSSGVNSASDNALLGFKQSLKISTEEIRQALEYLSPDGGYDTWRTVGMALHHQFNGDNDGLELWDEWSQASTQYDRNEIEEKWPSFSETPDGRMPVTVASLLKMANEAKREQQNEEFERILNVIRLTTDSTKLFGEVAKQAATTITEEFQFDIAAKKIQERAKELTGVAPRIDVVRKTLVNAKPKKTDNTSGVPDWCQGWVFLENADRFFHVETKQELTEKGFNAKYDRELLSEQDRALGVSTPDARASQKALNVYEIPTVYSTVYLPGHDKLVEINGQMRANTFNEVSIPASKAAETEEEREAIRLVEQHFRMTFPDERERTLVKDYLAYNVQFPAEKIAWGVLVVGAEGVGKTWFLKFMQMMLGPQNVAPLAASALQETFNGWAEGTKMRFIEEIRLHGQNRYEVIEKLKEPVGNEDIEIRRMNRDRYVIPNVTNYFAFSNYWDAMPVKKNNRRYLVVGTQLQTDDEVQEFNDRYPNYFADLFAATFQFAPVLRGWLMTHTLSQWFEPKRPAPETAARLKMADMADVTDENDVLSKVLEKSDNPAVSNVLLCLDALRDVADVLGETLPSGRALNALLMKSGFHSLDRIKIEPGGELVRCYTREPNLYHGDKYAVVRAVIEGRPLPTRRDFLALDAPEDDGIDPWA